MFVVAFWSGFSILTFVGFQNMEFFFRKRRLHHFSWSTCVWDNIMHLTIDYNPINLFSFIGYFLSQKEFLVVVVVLFEVILGHYVLAPCRYMYPRIPDFILYYLHAWACRWLYLMSPYNFLQYQFLVRTLFLIIYCIIILSLVLVFSFKIKDVVVLLMLFGLAKLSEINHFYQLHTAIPIGSLI